MNGPSSWRFVALKRLVEALKRLVEALSRLVEALSRLVEALSRRFETNQFLMSIRQRCLVLALSADDVIAASSYRMSCSQLMTALHSLSPIQRRREEDPNSLGAQDLLASTGICNSKVGETVIWVGATVIWVGKTVIWVDVTVIWVDVTSIMGGSVSFNRDL
jgi:hypothetical protein